jgi:hypothetical protein
MLTDRFTPLHEVLPELAGALEVSGHQESEWEWEGEWDGEAEAEGFFDRLAALVAGGGTSPALRRLGASAARAALSGIAELGSGLLPEMEDEMEVSPLARVYPDVAGMGGLDPISRVYPEAAMEMEHLGHVAAESPTMAEAEAHARRMVPVAVKAAPRVAHRVAHASAAPRPAHVVPRAVQAVRRAAPALAHGVTGVTRTLYRNPTTRHLIRTLPSIVANTTSHLVRQAALGRPITPQAAVRTLARQAARVVGNPAHGVRAWRRSRALDRRYHRVFGPGMVTPRPWVAGAGPSTTWSPGMVTPRPGVPGVRRAGVRGCGCCCCGCHRCAYGR